ncbi:MAG: hypothetical protein PS018_17250 [bacterium]|nr:hypothetical protein [bacterium]
MSMLESLINIMVGFGISLAAQMFFLPLIGVSISFSQNLTFALIMTVISIARSYLLRRLFEALHIRRPLSPFAQAAVAERHRQVEVEGFDLANDDAYPRGTLASAGAVYALYGRVGALDFWPWDHDWFKPQDHRRNLVRAAALIIAEGEKFDRNRKRKDAV